MTLRQSLTQGGQHTLTTDNKQAQNKVPNRKIRVLHVYRTYFPDTQGGLEEVIRQICANSIGHNIESRVLTLSEDNNPSILNLPEARVYRSKLTFEIASCGVSIAAFGLYRKLEVWADIIHFHFPWPFADVLHFSRLTRKPTLVTYHSDIVRQRIWGALYKPLMNRFLSSLDRIVCTSPNYFATSDVLTKYSSKVEVVPIGIDKKGYERPSQDTLDEVAAEYGENFFLFVGVLRYYKGLHILLDAVKNAPFKVVIAGSGPIEKELAGQAHAQDLDNVTFAGYVSNAEKNALFSLCRAVVFPSYLRSEAFGVTLLEGAMFRKALISTEVGSGTSHVNIHGRTGLVVPPGSSKGLRHAMNHFWQNPQEAVTMGENARLRYEQLFTGRLMGKRYAAMYRDMLESGFDA